MGYSGGKKQSPTYHDLGDHTESIEIDYDPSKVTYAQLVDLFWQWHNPCGRSYSRQYMSAVFHRTPEEKRLAEETKAREEKRRGATVHTAILPFEKFWLAEDYHQKYYLRSSPLMKAFAKLSDREFVDSTAAARANAYVAGSLTKEQLRAEAPTLALD